MITSDTLVKTGDWEVKKLYKDGEFSHYVLNYDVGEIGLTRGFDEVTAEGGLLKLNRGDTGTLTFTDVLDGTNKYVDNEDMPKDVFDTLKAIGPY